jgi:hypothetical protein
LTGKLGLVDGKEVQEGEYSYEEKEEVNGLETLGFMLAGMR